MRVAIVAFTRMGYELAGRLARTLASEGDDTSLCVPPRLASELGAQAYERLSDWAARAFASCDGLVFVSASGIAVRAVAPYARDKMSDPAVVSVDEGAGFVVPLLSGHVGGANELARRVGRICGATPVVSTATDVQGCFAVDLWAREQGLALLDREQAKAVSARLLEGGIVGLACDWSVRGALPEGLVSWDEGGDQCDLGISISLDPEKRPFPQTLRLVPQVVRVGIGCKRGTDGSAIGRAVDDALAAAHVAPQAVAGLATIDVKADEQGLLSLAESRGWPLHFFAAEELAAVPGSFASSDFVRQTVGVDNVCERAACTGGGALLAGRHTQDGVTVALAAGVPLLSFEDAVEPDPSGMLPSASGIQRGVSPTDQAVLTCVGLGPGGADDMTLRARAALDAADVIVGYTTYLDLVRDGYPDKEFVSTRMRGEVERCRLALERAARGERVAVVCSGDPGVYGMAGLLMELACDYEDVEVEVIPGVTAATGGAAVLGAPLMHDWCCISLSDLMTDWELIERRLDVAAQADFCICLYNPGSRTRTDHLRRACEVIGRHRGDETVCGLVRSIGRDGQTWRTLSLAELRDTQVDMLTCVYIGNSQTCLINGRMVTPRGYLQREA